jgi:hypothetical protein
MGEKVRTILLRWHNLFPTSLRIWYHDMGGMGRSDYRIQAIEESFHW